jgi:thiol:disulfide interchange protein
MSYRFLHYFIFFISFFHSTYSLSTPSFETKKNKLFLWTAPWCQPCLELKDLIQGDPEIKNLIKNYDLLILDSSSNDDQKWANSHGVGQSFPQMLFLDRDENELVRITTAPSKDEFIAILKTLDKASLTSKQLFMSLNSEQTDRLNSVENWQLAIIFTNQIINQKQKLEKLQNLFEKCPEKFSELRGQLLENILSFDEKLPSTLVNPIKNYIDSAIKSTSETKPLQLIYRGHNLYKSLYGQAFGERMFFKIMLHFEKQISDPSLHLTYRLRVLHALSSIQPKKLDIQPHLEKMLNQEKSMTLAQKGLLVRSLFESNNHKEGKKLAITYIDRSLEPAFFSELLASNASDKNERLQWRKISFDNTSDLPTRLLRGYYFLHDLPLGEEKERMILAYLTMLQSSSQELLENNTKLISKFFQEIALLPSEKIRRIQSNYQNICSLEDRCKMIAQKILNKNIDLSKSDPVLLTIKHTWNNRGEKIYLKLSLNPAFGFKVYSLKDKNAPLSIEIIDSNRKLNLFLSNSSIEDPHSDYFNNEFHIYSEFNQENLPKEPLKLRVDATLCDRQCIRTTLFYDASIAPHYTEAISDKNWNNLVFINTSDPTQDVWLWIKILLMGLIGGFILNFMPCVLPVIGMKIESLLKKGDMTQSQYRAHLASYCFGIIVSFLIFGAMVFLLKVLGQEVGWGFHMQSPTFVLCLVFLTVGLSLNLFGIFEFQTPFAQKINKIKGGSGLSGDFLNGIITTVLATPCSAPFLGTVFGTSLSGPPLMILPTFFSVGLGLCSPFILLAILPKSRNFLPRRGSWMLTLKNWLGILMLLSSCWLLYSLSSLKPKDILFVFIVHISLVLLITSLIFLSKKSYKWIIVSLAISIPLSYLQFSDSHEEKITTEWSEDHLIQYQNNNKNIFLEFTAEWCLTCKINHTLLLDTKEFLNWLDKTDSIYMIGDYTSRNEKIDAFLKRQKVSGVPAYFFKNKSGELTYLGSTLSLKKLEDISIGTEKIDTHNLHKTKGLAM